MPEGDSVHHAARRIHAALAGRRLARAELRVPRFAAVDLRGRTVERAYARGKHLFVVVGPDAAGRDPVTLHVHLKMEGRIHVHRLHVYRGGEPRAGRRWRFPAHTARLVLATGDDDEAAIEVVGTELGLLRALTPAEADEAVAHLGPDLLDPDWDPARHLDEAVRRLASRPDRTIGEALLDQRNVAGIGTIYRAEVCFLRGVDPREPVASAGDLRALADLARRLLVANVDRPDRVTTGDTRRGRRLWAYGRDGRPCLRCGTLIEGFRLGGDATGAAPMSSADSLDRVAFRCPTCQPRRAPAEGDRATLGDPDQRDHDHR